MDTNDLPFQSTFRTFDELTPDDVGHDACGITAIQGPPGQNVMALGLEALRCNDIRGGQISINGRPAQGDGAGIMVRTYDDDGGVGLQSFFRRQVGRDLDLDVPLEGAHFFLASNRDFGRTGEELEEIFRGHDLDLVHFHRVNINPEAISPRSRRTMPQVAQVVYVPTAELAANPNRFSRKLLEVRLAIRKLAGIETVSLQPGTMVWKGMCLGRELERFYPDLTADDFQTNGAMIHVRYATNVASAWVLAQPFDIIGHNGEVNSIDVIIETIKALENEYGLVGTNTIPRGSDSSNLNGTFQMVVNFLGLSLEEAVRFVIHPPQDDLEKLNPKVQKWVHAVSRILRSLKAIGPIGLLAMNRDKIVATVDNMAFRPLTQIRTHDGLVILGSEMGMPSVPEKDIVQYGRFSPSEIGVVYKNGDSATPLTGFREAVVQDGSIELSDGDRKAVLEERDLAGGKKLYIFDRKAKLDFLHRRIFEETALDYETLSSDQIYEISLDDLAPAMLQVVDEKLTSDPETIIPRGQAYGLNKQRLGKMDEAIGAQKDPIEGMGSDIAHPVLSPEPHSIGRHIITHHAQITNPATDFKRKEAAFSISGFLGSKPTKKDDDRTPDQFFAHYQAVPQFQLDGPLLGPDEIKVLYALEIAPREDRPKVRSFSTVFENRGILTESCEKAIERIAKEVVQCARNRSASVAILSDRTLQGTGDFYIPPLILVSYIRLQLNAEGLQDYINMVVDTGEMWDQHEYALLIAGGAVAVHPHMIYEYIDRGDLGATLADRPDEAQTIARENLKEAFNFTLNRYMAKLGITTVEAYRGTVHKSTSTVGLNREFVRKYFGADVTANDSGNTLEDILQRQLVRGQVRERRGLRKSREKHALGKKIMLSMQKVGIVDDDKIDDAWAKTLEEVEAAGPFSPRDLLQFRSDLNPVPLDEVEATRDIIRSVIQIGGMSYGALNRRSWESVHELARHYDMNANAGEGGVPDDMIDLVNSVQVASGGFLRVEALAKRRTWEDRRKELVAALERLVEKVEVALAEGNGDGRKWRSHQRELVDLIEEVERFAVEIEFKAGQGAKPGIGGHLPGRKVFPDIAELRGVELGQDTLSPPTQPDVYSIEDLLAKLEREAALRPDAALLPVKLTASKNIAQVSLGVTKAQMGARGKSKNIICGWGGGTGAASRTDKDRTGLPPEYGIIKCVEAYAKNGVTTLSDLVADGGIRTGTDIAKLLAFGARKANIGTILLIVQQLCIHCEKCHTQECPAYITRSDSTYLSSTKKGRKKEVVEREDQRRRMLTSGSRLLEVLAGEIRKILAGLGLKRVKDLIGRRDLLEVDPRYRELAVKLDETPLLRRPTYDVEAEPHQSRAELAATIDYVKKYLLGDPDHIDYYLDHQGIGEANQNLLRQIVDSSGDGPIEVDLANLKPADRNVGATLAGLMVRGEVEGFTDKVKGREIHISTSAFPGLGLATALQPGVTVSHHGVIPNETGWLQEGGTIIARPPAGPLADRHDLDLCGNTLAYAAHRGRRYLQMSVGNQCLILCKGGETAITGNTGKYLGIYMLGGFVDVLGSLGTEVGAGMTGGEIYSRDPNLAGKLSKDVMVTPIASRRDLERLRERWERFSEHCDVAVVKEMLANWEEEKKKFQKIVAKGQYGTKLFEYFYSRLEEREFPENRYHQLMADLFELCGADIDCPDNSLTKADMEIVLDRGYDELVAAIEAMPKKGEIEQVFMFTRGFASDFADRLQIRPGLFSV